MPLGTGGYEFRLTVVGYTAKSFFVSLGRTRSLEAVLVASRLNLILVALRLNLILVALRLTLTLILVLTAGLPGPHIPQYILEARAE